MDSQKKLILLGFCAGAIPPITEMAEELENITTFDIVKNVEVQTRRPFIVPGYSVNIFSDKDYEPNNYDAHPVHFGVLSSHIKYILFEYFSRKYGLRKEKFLNLIRHSSHVSKSSETGHGFFMDHLSVVSSFTKIGFGVTIKRGSSMGHHCEVGDYVNLNPGTVVSGYVTIGEGSEIGTGVSVVNNVSIGRHCLIGAGSVVTKDIPDGVIAYGNPCKVIRVNDRWEKAKRIISQYKNETKLKEPQQ
ncbi:hypothetical protein BH23BAC3_BH23BAC3_30180 [soil metagenome]